MDSTGSISNLDDLNPDRAGVVKFFVKEVRNGKVRWTPKSMGKNLTVQEELDLANSFISSSTQSNAERFRGFVELNGYLVEVRGYLNPDQLRTWYLVYNSAKDF